MSPRKKRSATRMSKGKSEKKEGNAQNGKRSASEAFDDDSNHSVESPLRKKQDALKPTPDIRALKKTRPTARRSISNDNGRSANGYSRDPGVGLTNGDADAENDTLPTYSLNEEQEDVLDIAPPARNAPIRPTTVATKSKIKIAQEVDELETTLPTSQNGNCGNGESSSYGDVDVGAKSGQTWIESLGWFGFFVFFALFVLSGVVWTGLILSERAFHQLESIECQERLYQTYLGMGLEVDFEDMGDSDMDDYILDRFKEQKFYWEELESQVRHWKSRAKKAEETGKAYREQCQENLQQFISEFSPDKVNNQDQHTS